MKTIILFILLISTAIVSQEMFALPDAPIKLETNNDFSVIQYENQFGKLWIKKMSINNKAVYDIRITPSEENPISVLGNRTKHIAYAINPGFGELIPFAGACTFSIVDRLFNTIEPYKKTNIHDLYTVNLDGVMELKDPVRKQIELLSNKATTKLEVTIKNKSLEDVVAEKFSVKKPKSFNHKSSTHVYDQYGNKLIVTLYTIKKAAGKWILYFYYGETIGQFEVFEFVESPATKSSSRILSLNNGSHEVDVTIEFSIGGKITEYLFSLDGGGSGNFKHFVFNKNNKISCLFSNGAKIPLVEVSKKLHAHRYKNAKIAADVFKRDLRTLLKSINGRSIIADKSETMEVSTDAQLEYNLSEYHQFTQKVMREFHGIHEVSALKLKDEKIIFTYKAKVSAAEFLNAFYK